MEASSEFSADGYNVSNPNHFTVDDLFNFPQEDNNNKSMTDGVFFEPIKANSVDYSSTVTAVDSCNSSVSGGETTQFNGSLSSRSFTDVLFPGGELCVPYDDLGELEWLSNFVEESLSSEDNMHNLQFIPTTTTPPSTTTPATVFSGDKLNQNSLPILPSEVSIPGKARSKRPRAAPCDWSSRLLLLPPATSSSDTKRGVITDTPGRKCLHCASEKTPQWRSGPMGPKTLCNACGVRYKSGRLVAEYRPASSPTFVSAKHSNSHRKVLEMRRQKEMQREQPHEAAARQLLSQNGIFSISNGGDDYLIHQPQQMKGHDFNHMI